MRKFAVAIAAATASVFVGASASAMPFNRGVGEAADRVSAVEKTQFVYLGRNYCWYPDGWHGPGFYWCGYAWRSGFGWGGPIGWRGWYHGGPRVVGPRVYGGRTVIVGPRGGRVVGPGGGGRFVGGRPGGGGGRGPGHHH